jgi:YVTN family beta-propeller protein
MKSIHQNNSVWGGTGLLIAGLALSASVLGSPASAIAATPQPIQGTVWVADEHGNSITVIDAATNKIVTTLTGIEGPHNLQVAPDGKSVWAVSGHQSLAVMIDPATYTVHGTVPTGKMPAHDDNTVSAIDVATMKTLATIPVGKYPHGLRPSPDGKWIYIANAKDTTLSVIDTTTNKKVTDIQVGQRPVQVGFSPDGKFVYFSLNGENAIGKVDVTTRKLLGSVKVGAGPIQVFVSPDNKYVLAANQGTEQKPSTTVSIIDAAKFSVVGTVETGKGAHGVVVDPSSKYAYITNIYGNDVAVIDIAAQKVLTTIASGEAPNGISFSPLKPAKAPAKEIALPMPDAMPGMDSH